MFSLLLAMSLGADPQPPAFVVENKVPNFTVKNKVKASCPNCSTCGDSCPCFGGGYYCKDGSCPVATPGSDPRGVWSPVWDGRQWQPRWLQAIPTQSGAPYCPPGQS